MNIGTASRQMYPIQGVVRRYAWGSTTAIQELLDLPVDGQPAAELWLGAHPDDPAFVVDQDTMLDALIAADPDRLLGAELVGRWGVRLPFLLKVIAADKALSIQVHPDLTQARAGFAAERGLPPDSPERNYRDPNHKPELLCALTPFTGLCGFRPIAATLELFAALAVPALAPYAGLLAGPDGLRRAFTALLDLSEADRATLIPEVIAGCETLAAAGGPWRPAAHSSLLAAGDFPGDLGAVVALLLNTVELEPGQAIFLGAGNVHAYLRGTGVEVMANSDNVLRCGLTPKRIDVAELLKITDFTALPDPIRSGTPAGPFVHEFPVPVADFGLSVVEPADAPVALPPAGPRILLCTAGALTLAGGDDDDDELFLTEGQAVFVAAAAGLRVSGAGTVYVATTGRPQ